MPDRIASNRRCLLAAGALLAVSSARAAANAIEGSGTVVDQARAVGQFHRLEVNGPIDVRLKAGDSERVVVHADDNIAPLIETRVQRGVLIVGLRPGASFRTRRPPRIDAQARRMTGIVLRGAGKTRADRIDTDIFDAAIQGSGDIRIDALRVGTLAVSITGSGDFRAAGRADSVGVVIDGAGDIHVAEVLARQVAVRIAGSGDARVHATEALKVDIDGSGDVRYRGTPRISKRIGGSGAVEPL